MTRFWRKILSGWKQQRGSVLQENALWIALIVVAAVVVLGALSTDMQNSFRNLQCALGGQPEGYTCPDKTKPK